MSNISMIIEERPADIGNFLVGRLLPFKGKRMVGPFIFIDHMGPASLSDHANFDVPPHPHIGLSTLTYLFEGSIMHRDSMGNAVEVNPGAVNWMTAGRGVVHSERTPEYLRHSEKSLHGLQVWVALPKELETMEPSFHHIDREALPQWQENGLQWKLIAGEIMGHKSPVPVYSQLYFIEIVSNSRQQVNLARHLYGETALYILQGSVETDGHTFAAKQLLVAKDSHLCSFVMEPNTTVYIFGGNPFPEERYIYWNFVATDLQLIDAAKEKWHNQQFAHIPGETGFVPLPLMNAHVKQKE